MFINITGIDGCGKGTQIDFLYKYIENLGYSPHISKAYGQAEKETFSLYIEYANDLAIMFLFQAFHVHQKIDVERALKKEKVVISDRWDEAYLAYHSSNGVLMNDPLLRDRLHKVAFGCLKPDISFLLDVSPEECMKRCRIRGPDFFDKKGLEYHTKLSLAYKKIAMNNAGWVILDGTKPVTEVHREIIHYIQDIIV